MKKSGLGLLLFLVAVIGWVGVVRAQVKQFSGLLLSSKARSVEEQSYKQRLEDVKVAKAQGEAVQGTLRSLYLAMPKSSQIPEVLVMIEALGNQAGVVFGTASVGSPSGQEVPVSISFVATQDSATKFLNAIYSNVRTANVKSQTVSSDQAGSLTFNVQLGLVYQGGGAIQ